MSGTTRRKILADLATAGPLALSVMRESYGQYAYQCVWKLVADGLVEVDGRTKAFTITGKGRDALDSLQGEAEP